MRSEVLELQRLWAESMAAQPAAFTPAHIAQVRSACAALGGAGAAVSAERALADGERDASDGDSETADEANLQSTYTCHKSYHLSYRAT
jgi:hypothetical protein